MDCILKLPPLTELNIKDMIARGIMNYYSMKSSTSVKDINALPDLRIKSTQPYNHDEPNNLIVRLYSNLSAT